MQTNKTTGMKISQEYLELRTNPEVTDANIHNELSYEEGTKLIHIHILWSATTFLLALIL